MAEDEMDESLRETADSVIGHQWAERQALLFIKAQDDPGGTRYRELMERFRQPPPRRLEYMVAALGQISYMFGLKLEVEQKRPLEEILKEAEAFFDEAS